MNMHEPSDNNRGMERERGRLLFCVNGRDGEGSGRRIRLCLVGD